MFWEQLGKAANILQLISFIFPIVTGAYFLLKSRELNRRLKALAKAHTSRPAAIAIGVGGSIEGNVRQYLADNSLQMEVVALTLEGMAQPADLIKLLHEVSVTKQKLDDAGITEVHVFYRGPVTFAAALGAVLRNWVPAKLYAFEHGTYVLHMYLDKETVLAP